MTRPFPPRPKQDFRITTFAWQLDIETNHRNAGFPAIPQEVLLRRFWQLLSFLQDHKFTTRIIASSAADISLGTELRNSDLTDDGYRFVQRYGDKWAARMHKDTAADAEAKLLAKWLHQFHSAGA